MVKTVLAVNHEGLSDWIIQRLSAILMVIYTVGLLIFFFQHPNTTYDDWHTLFSHTWVKISTLLVLLALLYHAWIGMWTVFTDYIKCAVVRSILNTVVLIGLFAMFFDGLFIMWGV